MWPIIMNEKVERGDLKFRKVGPFPLRKMFSATGTALVLRRMRSGVWYLSTQSTDHPTCHRPLTIMFDHSNSHPASLILTLGFFSENAGAMVSPKSQQL